MRTLLSLASCLAGLTLCAQAVKTPFLSFADTTGSQNFFYKSVTKTDGSGNIYVAGATVNGAGNRDLLLAKYNAAGNLQWIEQYDGAAHAEDFATALYIDGSGNVFVTGAVTNNTTTALPDLATIKYNSSGVQQWLNTFDGSGNSYDAGADITLDGSGNIYVTGGAYNATPNSDIVTLKYNSSGTQQWASQFDAPTHQDDAGLKLSVSGSTVTVSVGSQSTTAAYRFGVFKYAVATGSITGSSLTSTVTTAVDLITDMATDASGNIFLSGAVPTMSNGYDMYLIKFNSSLAVQWQQTYNGAGNLDDAANGIATDASGNLYVSGYVSTASQGKDFVTQKYNSSGTLQWTQSYNSDANGDDAANDITLDNSGNVYSIGYKTSDINLADYYTVKYDGSGTKIWDIQSDFSHQPDMAMGLVIDTLGDVVVTGQTQTALNTYKYYTVKYIEKDVITPTDYNGETTNVDFYQNKGQLINLNDSLVPDIKYYTTSLYPEHYIKNNSCSYVFCHTDHDSTTTDTIQRVDLTFNSALNTEVYPLEFQKSYQNYFLSHIPNGITGVFGNRKVICPEIYRNIDLMYSSNENGIKYYFIVKPGGNPANIQPEFTGATSYSLNGTTNELSINTVIGSLTFDRPTAYQLTTSNATVAVTGWTPDWQTNGASNKYKFNTGTYTSSLTLIIEVDQGNALITSSLLPPWGTFYGGSKEDIAYDMVSTKVNGDLYATGTTGGGTFPVSTGPNFFVYNGGYEAFVTKFDRDYTFKFTALYGGNSDDKAYGITYDNTNRKVYFCGESSSTPSPLSSPTKALAGSSNSYVNSIADFERGFIARLDSLGNLEWATRFGNYGGSAVKKIQVDKSGNIYVVGTNMSPISSLTTCNSTPSGAFQHCNPGSGAYFKAQQTGMPNSCAVFNSDGYLARFDPTTQLTWSTLIGGDGDDFMQNLTIDDANNKLYVVGYTTSLSSGTSCSGSSPNSNFPLCAGTTGGYFTQNLNHTNGCSNPDGFILQFSLPGASLDWGTYFGGGNEDVVTDVTVDPYSNLFVTGYTKSSTATNNNCDVPTNSAFPTCNLSGYTQSFGGVYDAFVTKFDANRSLAWSTFLGGSGVEEFAVEGCGPRIELNPRTNGVYITGNTKSCDFPTLSAGPYFQQNTNNDSPCSTSGSDAFVAGFDNNGNQVYSSYFGGTGDHASGTVHYGELVTCMATYLSRVYIGGVSYSTSNFPFNCPGTFNPYCHTYVSQGQGECFYAQLADNTVGIQEFSKAKISNSLTIYPNPSENFINFEWSSAKPKRADISIINSIGQNIRQYSVMENEGVNKQTLQIQNITSGVYFIVIKTDSQFLNGKFVKE